MIWPRPQLRVLFVCSANVCRSPLAEGLLRHRLRALGLARRVQVRSAGSRAGQRGRRPDPRVEKLAVEAGVSLGRIRTRILTPQMLRKSDYVLVMERGHLDDVARLCATGDAPARTSVGNAFGETNCPQNLHLLGSFLPPRKRGVQDIPDPYYGDWQSFVDVYELIDSALDGLLECIEIRLGIFRES